MERVTALAIVPAGSGRVAVTLHNLPTGRYAVAMMHDEDQNGDLSMDGEGPTEGYGFVAMSPSGLPPKFEDAAIAAAPDARAALQLKYWQ